jgi:hypothetical protein
MDVFIVTGLCSAVVSAYLPSELAVLHLGREVLTHHLCSDSTTEGSVGEHRDSLTA